MDARTTKEEWRNARIALLRTLLGLGMSAFAAQALVAQDAPPVSAVKGKTVNWNAAPGAVPQAKRGGRVLIVLRGTPVNGWHIYGLKQQESGPIPLRVLLDPTELASAHGQPVASPPVKVFEPAFGLETPYYQRDFTVGIPVRVKANAPLGRQSIPVSVRYQACSGGTCEPPRTIHLSAPIQVVPAS